MPDWKATLNGVTLCGGDCANDDTVAGCLTLPPDGLGVPPLRTEDLSYPQRDGVEHFSDWYEPRIITLTGLIADRTSCGCSGTARANARALANAWSRACGDTELVLHRDCAEANPQLLANPAFDAGISDWSAGANTNLDWFTDEYRSAPASMQATLTLDNNGISFGTDTLIQVEPLNTYQAAGFVSNQFGTLPRRFYITIELYDTDGVTLIGSYGGDLVQSATAAWERMVLTYEVGTFTGDYGWVKIRVEQDGSDPGLAGESFLFDDFSLYHLDSPEERELNGPFGVRGRARVAELIWRRGRHQIADGTFRFDGTDHRLYVLDADGTPGSGAQCATLDDPPAGFSLYESVVASVNGGVVDSHWPLDFTRIMPGDNGVTVPVGWSIAEDVKGSSDAPIRGGYNVVGPLNQGPPISWNLSMSAVVGPALIQGPALPNPYSGGAMFGWWQQVDGTTLPSGSIFTIGNASIGANALGEPSPEIRWAGTNVAMNADVQDSFGFTNALRDQPVLIVITWNGTTLEIYAGHENSGATKLIQSVNVGAFPTPGGSAPRLTILGRASNVMFAVGGNPNGETITDALTPYAFDTPPSELLLPNAGELCAPIDVTFTPDAGYTIGDVYIFKEDGTYVGLQASGIGVDNPSSLDTDAGTARGLYDTTDFTPRITGNPFLQVNPGETLHIFGGFNGTVTVCYRPAVLSA